jgi:hypothetical protein
LSRKKSVSSIEYRDSIKYIVSIKERKRKDSKDSIEYRVKKKKGTREKED